MQSNNESAKSAMVFSLQHQMETAINTFIHLPSTAKMSLDDIYETCFSALPETTNYLGEGAPTTRKYLVRIAISNALRAWIDNEGMAEARAAMEKKHDY